MLDKILGPEEVIYNGFELEPTRKDCLQIIVVEIILAILFFGAAHLIEIIK